MSERNREMIEAVAGLEDEDDADSTEYVRPQPPSEPSQVYSVRVPRERIEELRLVAERKGVPPSTLMRSWVIERLDREQEEGEAPVAQVFFFKGLSQPDEVRARLPLLDGLLTELAGA